jgi:hypothetical protein
MLIYGGYDVNISDDPLRNSKRKRDMPKNQNPIYPTKPSGTDIVFHILFVIKAPIRQIIMYKSRV